LYNFQNLVNSKKSYFILKGISPIFRPSSQLAHSAFWPTQCPSSSSHTKAEHTSHRRRPVLRRPHGRPRPPPLKGKKSPRHLSIIFPLSGAPSLLQSSGNRHLQSGSIEAHSMLKIEGTRPPSPRLHPIKGCPTPDEVPHNSNSPSLSPHRAHIVALLSRCFTAGAPPPRRLPSLGTRKNRIPVAPSIFSPPRGKPPWPGAATRPSSGEIYGQPPWSASPPWTVPCVGPQAMVRVHYIFY
jgi:hypothetical protein